MSKIFDLKHQKAHRALDDALATADLLLKYLTIFIDKKIHKVNSLYYPKNKFELDRIHYKKTTPLEEVIAQIENMKAPILVTLKGQEGIVLFSFPSLSTEKEKKYIIQKIKEIPYEILTIKMIGPYFQGLIELSTYFSKLSEPLQKEIIQKLCEFQEIDFSKVNQPNPVDYNHDFIVMNHLIPDQFVIYPLRSLHHKMELVFRYPTHQNKLVQYINSKSIRMSQSKMKKDHLAPVMNNFLCAYLEKGKGYLLIHKSQQKIVNADIKSALETFMEENPNNFNFPQNYL